jgi:hypothetical protein
MAFQQKKWVAFLREGSHIACSQRCPLSSCLVFLITASDGKPPFLMLVCVAVEKSVTYVVLKK